MKSWRFAYSDKCSAQSFKTYLWLIGCIVGIIGGIVSQPLQGLASENKQNTSSAKIQTLSEINFPAASVKDLLSQSPINPPSFPPYQGGKQGGVVIITGVKANPTDKGMEVILQTTQGEQLQITNRSAENTFIADIPNAQLRLPSGDAFTFRSETPVAEITEITVTNVDANNVRVTVIGEKALPTVELFDGDEGLIFSVVGAVTSAQQPETLPQQPDQATSETQPETPPAADESIELVVTGEQDSYRVPNASTATKTDTPLRDIPASIQVIPRQLIEDRQARQIADVLRNISGVQQPTSGSTGGHFDIFTIRGFNSVNEGVLRNGLKDRVNTQLASDPANLERIEVLKGPVAALFGQGGLGATINLVTKRPLSEPYGSVTATAGNFNFYRGEIDLSSPLNDSKTLLYRLNAAVQTSESFIDFVDSQRYFISPVITWLISDRTKLTFETEINSSPRKNEWGIPAEGSVLTSPFGEVPRSRYVGNPDDYDNRSGYRIGYEFDHRFSDNWQIRNAFRTTSYGGESRGFFPSSLAADGRTLNGSYTVVPEQNFRQNYTVDTYVTGKFNTGGIQHQVVAGFDWFREYNPVFESFSTSARIDIFNPVYGRPSTPLTRTLGNELIREFYGFYLQDQITLSDNLKVLLGGRFDIARQSSTNPTTSVSTSQENQAFSPRVGIVYQPIQPISLYASYGEAFTLVVGTTFDNQLFEPERGTQYEVGVKADFTDRISATLAFFDLTRSNVLTPDLRDTRFSIQTGEQRSQGIELDLAGEIMPGWNVIASAAYTDARVTDDNRFAVGNLLANSPLFSASLWTSYEFQKGNLEGLGFGLGLYYVGDRQGDLTNTFSLPSYLRTDASIFYKRDQLRLTLGINNLFNTEYYESAGSRARVNPGVPFTVQGTIALEF